MTTPTNENAAALLRRQQSTTARLRVGLPALLVHLEHTDLLGPESAGAAGPATDPSPTDAAIDTVGRDDPGRDEPDPPTATRTWF